MRRLKYFPVESHLERYRDIFFLMFYMVGINAKDLLLARPEDVQDGRLVYRRAKTGKLYSVRIEPEAAEIIEKYRGENYLLNIMDTYKDYHDFLKHLNIGLKQIGEVKYMSRPGRGENDRGGKKIFTPLIKGISSYYARHTWASVAYSIDIPVDIISQALGHSATSGAVVTSVYINKDRKKVDDANRKVIDYVFHSK